MTTFTRQFDLYLGRDIGKTGFVDSSTLAKFFADKVVPHYPCFTLLDAVGSWEGKREVTTVLRILGSETDTLVLRAIATAYRERFSQDAVLLVASRIYGELI